MAENNPAGVEDKDQRAATEATEQIKDEGQRTVGEGTAPRPLEVLPTCLLR